VSTTTPHASGQDDKLARQLRSIAPALISVVFLEFAISSFIPLVGVQLTLRDVPTTMIGVIGSAYFIGFILGGMFAARVLDRVGHIRALSVFAIIAIDSALLMALFSDPWIWLFLRMPSGFSMAGIWVTIETWLNHKATRPTRGRLFAIYMVVAGACSSCAPLLLRVVDPAEITLFLIIALFYAAAIVPMAITRESNPEIGDRARFGLITLYGISPLSVVACFGNGMCVTGFSSLMPVYVQKIGLTPADLAVLLFSARAGGMVGQYPIGLISDHVGRRPVILAVLLLGLAGALFGVFFGAQSFWLLVAASMIYATATWPLYALCISYTGDNCRPQDLVAANGGLLLTWAIGGIIGPTAAGWTVELLGHDGLFIFLAAVLGVLVLFTLFRMTQRTAAAPRPKTTDEPAGG